MKSYGFVRSFVEEPLLCFYVVIICNIPVSCLCMVCEKGSKTPMSYTRPVFVRRLTMPGMYTYTSECQADFDLTPEMLLRSLSFEEPKTRSVAAVAGGKTQLLIGVVRLMFSTRLCVCGRYSRTRLQTGWCQSCSTIQSVWMPGYHVSPILLISATNLGLVICIPPTLSPTLNPTTFSSSGS